MLGAPLLRQFTEYRQANASPLPQSLPPTKAWFLSLFESLNTAISALQDPYQIARLSIKQIVEICGHFEELATLLIDSEIMSTLSVKDKKNLGKIHSYIALKIIMDPTVKGHDRCVLINYFAKIHDQIKQFKDQNKIPDLPVKDEPDPVDEDAAYDPNEDLRKLSGAKLVVHCRSDNRAAITVLNQDELLNKLTKPELAALGGNDPIVAGIILMRNKLKQKLIPNCAPRSQAEKDEFLHNNPIYFLCEKFPSTAKKVLSSDLVTCLPEMLIQRLNEKIKVWEALKAFCDSDAVSELKGRTKTITVQV